MSRVDDDREAQRMEEQRILERRDEEARAATRKTAESTFARLVSEGHAEARTLSSKTASMQDVFRKLKEEQESLREGEEHALPDEANAQKRGQLRNAKQALSQSSKDAKHGTEERASQKAGSSQKSLADGLAGRAMDAGAKGQMDSSRRGQDREGDNSHTREALHERSAHNLKGTSPGLPQGAHGKESKADADGGGQGSSKQGGGDQKGGGGFGQTFRLNPALMAPAPVAQKRDTASSERLRRVASEIAQKIVERARVGTNAQGAVEFQMDLKSNVLNGLSIKVSAQRGRVQMIFAGADKDLLRELEQGSSSLKEALSARGLTIETLKFEAKA